MNTTPRVYLAGLISTTTPESLRWRTSAHGMLGGFAVVDPMRGKQDLARKSIDGGISDPRLTAADIVLRDYHDVLNSNVILANLNQWDSDRAPIGTFVELGWAWQARIPIVCVVDPADKNAQLVKAHPFLQTFVSHYFDRLACACAHIRYYYLENSL